MKHPFFAVICVVISINETIYSARAAENHVWTQEERETLQSLWLGSLPAVPADPSNAVSQDQRAVLLGKKLFSDTSLSANGKVACATCHMPEKKFTDELPVSHGLADTTRRAMPLAGLAYSPWFFWDGRADSLWSQALGPLENPLEHGITRTQLAKIILKNYREEYENLFEKIPEMDDERYPSIAMPSSDDTKAQGAWENMSEEQRKQVTRIFSNTGKAIAAFVRTIQHLPSRFDTYVAALLDEKVDALPRIYSREQEEGLRIFIGKGRCINCHNGPLFTNFDFRGIGAPPREGSLPDRGRAEGIGHVLASEFNCLGRWSDARPEDCAELRFLDTNTRKYEGAFKTPSLRNVTDRPPYMHQGQFQTIREVLMFYQKQSLASKGRFIGDTELAHGAISEEEMSYLEVFLQTLSGQIAVAK